MPLTPQEEAELAQLSQKYGGPTPKPTPAPQSQQSGLSPDEEAEFQRLSQKYGSQNNDNIDSLNTVGPRSDTQALMQFGQHHPGAVSPAAALAGGMLLGPVGTIAGAGLGSAAVNEIRNPGNQVQNAKNIAGDTIKNGVLPEALGAGIGLVGKGLGSAADRLQQFAMGVKKYTPGAGQAAIDAGVWGTRSRMARVMNEAVSQAGNDVGDAVKAAEGKVSSQAVADKVRELADNYTTTSGITPDQGKPIVKLINSRADKIAAQGDIDPQTAQELKLIAQNFGYSKGGTALQRASAEIPQQEAFGYGEQLGKLNPEYTQANQKYSNLMPGAKALESKEPMRGLGMRDIMVGGGAGAIMHSPVAALSAIAAERALTSPLTESVGAKGISGLAKLFQAGAVPASTTTKLAQLLGQSESQE